MEVPVSSTKYAWKMFARSLMKPKHAQTASINTVTLDSVQLKSRAFIIQSAVKLTFAALMAFAHFATLIQFAMMALHARPLSMPEPVK